MHFDSDAEDEDVLIQEMRTKAGLDDAAIKFVKATAHTIKQGSDHVRTR